jgi:hypothetical protein
MAMLALWLPATNHCRLEQIPGLEFLRCAADSTPNSDCSSDGDGCLVVESGFYKLENTKVKIAQPLLIPVTCLTQLVLEPGAPELHLAATAVDSLALPKPWQFTFRAAAPPRAPSFAS